jgi:hypothetical protein
MQDWRKLKERSLVSLLHCDGSGKEKANADELLVVHTKVPVSLAPLLQLKFFFLEAHNTYIVNFNYLDLQSTSEPKRILMLVKKAKL